jgi:hypothetical protein
VYGVVTGSLAKPARSTIIVWETEAKVWIQQKNKGPKISWRGRGLHKTFIPGSHVASTVLQVHDHVQLGVQRNSGNRDPQEAGGSRQEVSKGKGKLCEINGTVQWAAVQ